MKITTHTNGEIQRIQNQIAESKGELEQTITNASVSKEELNKSIETASDTKTALDKSVELVRTAKTELDTSTQKAGEAKTALDKSAETAGTVQETLNATVKQAGTLDTSLGEKIETGTQLKKDLTASGEKAVQDIQTAGSEQLDKMQAVAEEFTADREQITTNKEDIGSLKEDLSNKITKFYASNQGETHITDSDSGKIQDMVLYGKSKQERTTGAQLFPTITPSIEEKNGITVEYMEHGKIHISGTSEKTVDFMTPTFELLAGTYTLSIGVNIDNTLMRCTLSTVEGLPYFDMLDNEASKTETIKDNMILYLLLRVYGGKTIDITIQPMLNTGTSPLPWEPYTGGQPSPSPDYPQEIKSVVNPTVEVRGANLLKLSFKEKSNNGVTVDVIENKIRFHGTFSNDTYAYWGLDNPAVIKKGTKVSLYVNDFNNHGAFVWLKKVGDNSSLLVLNKREPDVTLKNDFRLTAIGIEHYTVGDTIDFTTTFAVLCNTNQYEPYHEQTVTIPYTLNAIPVASGGNVTINGQQYIADYVDVERGKLVRMCERKTLNTKTGRIDEEYRLAIDIDPAAYDSGDKECMLSAFEWNSWVTCAVGGILYIKNIKKLNNELYTAQELKALSIDFDVVYQLSEQQETNLTAEQTQALKELVTYYPVTNISVNSEQLDGYTVFNYPISLANGWNYVKQQIGDTREYIYDIDARTQDTDLQSAEAYVNSEYAVALTELEVM